MPIYTEPYTGTGRPLDFSEYKPSTGQVMKTAFGHAWDTNPLKSLDLLSRTRTDAQGSAIDGMDGFAVAGISGIVTDDLAPKSEPMPMEDQRKYIEDSGLLPGQVQPHESYDQEILDIIIAAKKEENARAVVEQRQTGLQTVAGLGAGLVASMGDPLNLASSVLPVPGLGPARMLPLLSKAASGWGRAGYRALEGAASGAFGAAVVEPLVYTGQQAVQADYTLANSLMNLAFGAVIGAGMKAGAGAWREHINVKLGKPQEWEYAPQTEATEAIRRDLERRMFEARKDSVPESEWGKLRETIADDVAVYDTFTRHMAWKEGILPEAIYETYGMDFYSGEIFDRKVLDARQLVEKYNGIAKELDGFAKLESQWNIGELRSPTSLRTLPELKSELAQLGSQLPEALRLIQADASIRTLHQGPLPPTTHPTTSPSGSPRIQGDSTEILVNNTISTAGEAAHYEVRELSDVIASHNPNQRFRRNDAYPQAAQERPYHSDEGEQHKVRMNALAYDPRHVINNDPTAIGGTPIIRQDGVVLGGNSRTMTLDLVYGNHPEKAAEYRNLLMEKAQGWFGIDPKQIESMQQPILVRVIEAELDENTTILKSRDYNQSLTQELQELAKGVSLGKKIGIHSGNLLSKGLDEFDGNLPDFLDSPKSVDFISSLIDEGVIMETERTTLLNKDGLLNGKGRTLIRNAFRGRVVPSYDILSRLSDPVLQKLDGVVAQVIRTEAYGKGWNLAPVVRNACEAIANAASAKRSVKTYFDSLAFSATQQKKYSDKAKMMALTLANAKAAEIRARMAAYAADADRARLATGGLTGEAPPSPWDIYARNFNTDLVSVGDARILGFRPMDSLSHQALHWAIENKHSTVKEARQALLLALKDDTLDINNRALLEQHLQQLQTMEGSITHDPPKLGGFREKEYHELKGDTEQTRQAWQEKQEALRKQREQWQKELEEKRRLKAEEEAKRKAEEEAPRNKPADPTPQQPAREIQPETNTGKPAKPGKPGKGKKGARKPTQQEQPVEPEIRKPRQIDNLESARAAITFVGETRAVIRFFKQADPTSGSHELYHMIARQLEDLALREDAEPYWRNQWQRACEFVGAEDGQRWTVEMHEKFARAGERYLLEGKAPTAQLEPVFERMKQRFLEVYVDADAAGLEISDGMRSFFDSLLTVPVVEGEQRIQRGIAALNSYQWQESFYLPKAGEPAANPRLGQLGENLESDRLLVDADTQELARTVAMLEASGGEMDKAFAGEIRDSLKLAERDLERARQRAKLLQEMVACNARTI